MANISKGSTEIIIAQNRNIIIYPLSEKRSVVSPLYGLSAFAAQSEWLYPLRASPVSCVSSVSFSVSPTIKL